MRLSEIIKEHEEEKEEMASFIAEKVKEIRSYKGLEKLDGFMTFDCKNEKGRNKGTINFFIKGDELTFSYYENYKRKLND